MQFECYKVEIGQEFGILGRLLEFYAWVFFWVHFFRNFDILLIEIVWWGAGEFVAYFDLHNTYFVQV